MRTLPLLSATLFIAAAVSFTSCRPSRVYQDRDRREDNDRRDDRDDRDDRDYRDYRMAPAPRTYSTFSLIITPTPGFVMGRYPDGRYYHRNAAGMIYWKGYDNRFYLDRNAIHRVRYSQWEYNEWKRFYRGNGQYNKRRRY